ncbi:DNA topoisomerase I, mitochondrial [Agrilus planipennis]|uniref:DNA topoisomerase I n=1 Tax=Agrilus planipennis TaxID=224129 RepID=A0A7F5R0V4_AGRPL|nr:DNA topoisomerase I, mitochondrial [Agrilus planipennis]
MDVENSVNEDFSDSNKRNKERNHVNGISNGYSDKHKSHKSDHKDKHRDKDRDKSKNKDHKSTNKDKDRHSSNLNDKHSSHKLPSKEKERNKKSDREKERDKERYKEKNKDDKKSSSSSKNKDHKSSKDRDKDYKSKDKERDRDKEKNEKDRHKDKEKHGSSKDKDHHKDKVKDKYRDKEKVKDKEKHGSSKSKEKRDKEKRTERVNEDDLLPKEELKNEFKYDSESAKEESVDDDEHKLVIKEEADDFNNDSTASSCDYSLSQFKDEPQFTDAEEEADDPQRGVKKEQYDDDDDLPLANCSKNSMKRKIESEDDDDDVPLAKRTKIKKEKDKEKKRKRTEDDETEYKPIKKEKKDKKVKKETLDISPNLKKGSKKKKEEETQEVWKWWEEEKRDDGTKWTFLEHKGPVFAPPYEPLPKDIKFYYDGKEVRLSEPAEEIAGFYAKMLDHDYTTKDIFNKNFFKDWRKVMNEEEQALITDLSKCDFRKMHAYFMDVAEKNRNRTKEEKKELKEKNEAIVKEYGFCTIDGHKEKIGNFKIEPPGLFRGRGEHPKMGKLKRRVEAEDIIINCSKDSKIPVPPPGHKWKEVRHDPSVTWLASWTENVQNQVKYIMLNPSSKLKGEKDMQKYETARRLHKCIDKIRREYKEDWKSKEMRIRQRAVALYFIDRLALRAGNEKDEDQADTVGCCSLRVEHIELHEERDGKEYVVVFDFLGKDSIRYYNEVPVEKRVFKNLQLFMENKKDGDDLFDRLNTAVLNKHLNELMEGLTAKVFRTYNASITLQQQLDQLTDPDTSVSEKILAYNRANRAVAILCNHQRSVPKGHQKSMEKLKEKIDQKREQIREAEAQVKDAQKCAKRGSVKEKTVYEKKKKTLQRLKEQLVKLEVQETDRDENKTIALGTSKLNYLDPRISVAWCKKYNVPIEKIYNKTQRDKFRWAIDMAGPDYIF